jgi:purine-binding chemotaxis protein CheW
MAEIAENKSLEDQKYKSGVFQIIVFKQGDEEYALQIDQIKEVVITPPITRLPQTPDFIKGVANIRGNIIAILDLEEMFNLRRTSSVDGNNNFTLVVESEDVKLGLLVREVPNTLSVSAADFDESVNIVQDSSVDSNYIRGIIKSNGRLIILIDIFKVIDHEMMSHLKRGTI